mgnify:CR=1 FL=1
MPLGTFLMAFLTIYKGLRDRFSRNMNHFIQLIMKKSARFTNQNANFHPYFFG